MAEAPIKSLKGSALNSFIDERVAALQAEPGLDEELLAVAVANLRAITKHPFWDLDHKLYPSLPTRPGFNLEPGGKAYSIIPIPVHQRHRFGGIRQRRKKWTGRGTVAWGHYLGLVDELVAIYANPAAVETAPAEIPGLEGLTPYVGHPESRIVEATKALFNTDLIKEARSDEALDATQAYWKHFTDFLAQCDCLTFQQLTKQHLIGYRVRCRSDVLSGNRAARTVKGRLAATKRVLGWVEAHLEIHPPPGYAMYLTNLSATELSSRSRGRNHRVGVAETVALAIEAVRGLMKEAEKDEFEYALMMVSWNLAAGAQDLADLTFEDTNAINPIPCVDMEHKLFITRRGKTGIPRWVFPTQYGLAIRMMDRTRQALLAWLDKREELIKELSSNRALANRMRLARESRRLKDSGMHTRAEIARQLNIPLGTLVDLLKLPADPAECARDLARKGYSLKDICTVTHQSQSTVHAQIKEIIKERGTNPHSHRYAIVQPDLDRVFFIPATGRPLVHKSGKRTTDYVKNVFNRLVERAGIVREVDIVAGKIPRPGKDVFILPAQSGHYAIRRTAATVAGMLGQVPENKLQSFMGHKSPEMTRRYVLTPPADYAGERMTHNYRITLPKVEDPVDAIEAFLDYCMK